MAGNISRAVNFIDLKVSRKALVTNAHVLVGLFNSQKYIKQRESTEFAIPTKKHLISYITYQEVWGAAYRDAHEMCFQPSLVCLLCILVTIAQAGDLVHQ